MNQESENKQDRNTPELFETPIFEEKELLERCGDDRELAAELVDLFLGEYPGILIQMEQSLRDSDFKQVSRHGHTLKGSVANFGSKQTFEAALRVENCAKQEFRQELDSAVEELKNHIERLRQGLVAFKLRNPE
jgi:HPt (histidine-containing phosphotransfer) domain-containing protein